MKNEAAFMPWHTLAAYHLACNYIYMKVGHVTSLALSTQGVRDSGYVRRPVFKISLVKITP